MNHQYESSTDRTVTSIVVRVGLALLILLALLIASANGQTQSENSVGTPPIHVTHVLGFEDVRRNVTGDLSIQDDALRFQRDGSPASQVTITSIQNIFLGEQDKQVGGVPMMLGKAALPYSGGRVVSLFSHKKYDSLTIEYRDSSGGFHGAIFRVAKGTGRDLQRCSARARRTYRPIGGSWSRSKVHQRYPWKSRNGASRSTELIPAPQLLIRVSLMRFTRIS